MGEKIPNSSDADSDEEFDPAASPGPVLRAAELFGEHRELWIEHNGERYRLRITRRGKLILQK